MTGVRVVRDFRVSSFCSSKFESSLEKKMNEKIIKIQNEMEEKVEALSIENEDLKKRLEVGTAQITSIKNPQANFNFIKIFLKVN
jgi:cell division septum initiation protein DivIVA